MLPFKLASSSYLPRLYCPDGVGYWSGHLPFAYDLVEALRPTTLVELGTYYGESYFTFCQAIAEAGIDCAAYAVDTWEGDRHTGRYANAVFSRVNSYNNEHYAAFSRLIRSQFDAALPQFSDGSVDVLHIDGLHTYDAVKNDFTQWLPKVRPGGIILLHDIAIRNDDFGVWKLWEELVLEYKTFSFQHSCGLGVLLKPGPVPAEGIGAILFGDAGVDVEAIRDYYELCADRLLHRLGPKRLPTRAATGFGTHVFWRPADEQFSESRSTHLYSSVLDAPEIIVLDIPPQQNEIAELRLDIADCRAQLELQSLRLLNSRGQELWVPDPANIVQAMPYSGMRTAVKEERVFLDISDGGSQMLLRTPKRLRRRLSEGLVVELRVRALSPDEVDQISFSGSPAGGGDPSITNSASLVVQQLEELRKGVEALGTGQRMVAERDANVRALTEGLAHAERVVASQLEELRKYDDALGTAQRLVAERDRELTSLGAVVAHAESAGAAQVEELRSCRSELGALLQRLSERDAEMKLLREALATTQAETAEGENNLREALSHCELQASEREHALREALNHAELTVAGKIEELRKYDDALGTTQRLVSERDTEITALREALRNAERSTVTQAEELRKYDTALAEAQRIVADRSAELLSMRDAFSQAEALAATQVQNLRRRDEALAASQLLVSERDARITALNLAYENADRVALDRERTLREALKDSEFAALDRESRLREALGNLERLATEREAGLRQALANAEQLAGVQFAEIRKQQETILAVNGLLSERDARMMALSAAHEHAQRAAEEREESLRAALQTSQAMAMEREGRLREALDHTEQLATERENRLLKTLANAERLAETQIEQLRRADRELATTQRLVSEREADIFALRAALGNAERLTEELKGEVAGYTLALENAKNLAVERDRQLAGLEESHATLRTQWNRAEMELSRVAKIVSEREAEIQVARRGIRQLQEERAGLSLRITEFENSRAIRLARLLGRGLRWS
jgi:hypothetical protein